MVEYLIEPRTRKHVKGRRFVSFGGKNRKQLLNTGVDAIKTASKKVVHKTDQFLGNEIVDSAAKPSDERIVRLKHIIDQNSRNVEEIIILQEKREEILNQLMQTL